MVIFWRGTGIIIPILLALSFWITSYWFEDYRFGNYSYMGWSILWPSILIAILGLSHLIKNEPDVNGVVEPNTPNDLMRIPVFIWGFVLLGLSIVLIFKGPAIGYGDNQSSTEVDTTQSKEMLSLYFYNSYEDTLSFKLAKVNDKSTLFDLAIPSKKTQWDEFEVGNYEFKFPSGGSSSFTLEKSTKVNKSTKHYSSWAVFGDIDLVLVNVSEACRSDINEDELRDIKWKDKVIKHYDGSDIIEVILNSKDPKALYKVYNPGQALPVKLKKNEVAFALIPYPKEKKYTELYLDSMIVDLCY